MTCYALTGSYQYPTQVMTGSVMEDISLIGEIIGCKVALSDHRSSNLTKEELIRLASDVRSGGLITGKAGVLVMHMGSGVNRLQHVLAALKETDIPVTTFWPTHMRRSPELIDEGIEFVNMGGTMDFTAGDDGAVAKLIAQLVNERGVPMETSPSAATPLAASPDSMTRACASA